MREKRVWILVAVGTLLLAGACNKKEPESVTSVPPVDSSVTADAPSTLTPQAPLFSSSQTQVTPGGTALAPSLKMESKATSKKWKKHKKHKKSKHARSHKRKHRRG